MKLLHPLLSILAASSVALAQNPDFINFDNDDILHGHFLGLTTSGKIIWKNDSADKNIAFETKDVRKIVMNKGQKTKPFTHTSYVTLKNLDTIPGRLYSLTNDELTLDTDYAGKITIQKDQITDINVNPLGDKIIYRGPFSEDEPWELKYPANLSTKELAKDKKEEPKSWKFKSFSLHHHGVPGSILMKTELPDQYRITFNSYSNLSYYPTFNIIADLKVPDYDKEDEEIVKNRNRYKTSPATILGTSLVIRLHPTNANITQYSFKKDGSLQQNNLPNTISGASGRSAQSKIFYDVRVDKKAGLIMLYADKRNIAQWQVDNLAEKFTGSYFGFNMPYNNANAKTVISDIVVTSWNGIRDSAISLENETRDIVMLTNGTDRYSGKITSITDSTINIKTTYAELSIPHDQVSSVNFATKKTEKIIAREKTDVAIRFHGTGRITGLLTKGDDGILFLESKLLGKLKIKSEFISSFEFVNMDEAYETYQ